MAGIQDISNITYLLHPPNPPWPPFFRELKICVFFMSPSRIAQNIILGQISLNILCLQYFPLYVVIKLSQNVRISCEDMKMLFYWQSSNILLAPCHVLLFPLFPVVNPVCTEDHTHPPPPPQVGLQFPAGPWNNVILQHLYYFRLRHLTSHFSHLNLPSCPIEKASIWNKWFLYFL